MDDPVSVQNPLLLASAWKRAGGTAELHIYPEGGHGYGLRPVEGRPVTRWGDLLVAWLARSGFDGKEKK